MKKLFFVLAMVMFLPSFVFADVNSENNLQATLGQETRVGVIGGGNANAQGGDARSDSLAAAVGVGGNPTSTSSSQITITSNVPQAHTPPIPLYAPYLPIINHGGWRIERGYFVPNGPGGYLGIYERKFNLLDPGDVKEIEGTVQSATYKGPLEAIGGLLNGISVHFLNGNPNSLVSGRGIEIVNTIFKDRRPKNKPTLIVLLDLGSNEREVLKKNDCVSVGMVGIEADTNRNWEQGYYSIVASACPWDVDVIIINGGMRLVTESNIDSGGLGGAYSQVNYAISLFGAVSKGLSEGKGKPVLMGECYRYDPELAKKRKMIESDPIYVAISAKRAELEQKQIAEQLRQKKEEGSVQGVVPNGNNHTKEADIQQTQKKPVP